MSVGCRPSGVIRSGGIYSLARPSPGKHVHPSIGETRHLFYRYNSIVCSHCVCAWTWNVYLCLRSRLYIRCFVYLYFCGYEDVYRNVRRSDSSVPRQCGNSPNGAVFLQGDFWYLKANQRTLYPSFCEINRVQGKGRFTCNLGRKQKVVGCLYCMSLTPIFSRERQFSFYFERES